MTKKIEKSEWQRLINNRRRQFGELDTSLTEAQAQQLEDALDDGFSHYGSLDPTKRYTLDGIVEDPFWEAKLNSSLDSTSGFDEFRAEYCEGDATDEEILAEYEDFLDDTVSTDAPHWRLTNPFGFDLIKIEAFFEARLADFARETGRDYHEELSSLDLLLRELTPFTKPWFEVQVLLELAELRSVSKMTFTHELTKELPKWWMVKSAGKIGRLIEHYRWRFTYGTDAERQGRRRSG